MIGLILLFIACIGVGRGDGAGQVVLTMLLTAVALQIGYLIAIALRSIALIFIAASPRLDFGAGPVRSWRQSPLWPARNLPPGSKDTQGEKC